MVTYYVVVNVDNPEQLLKPGMTANVTLVTARRDQNPLGAEIRVKNYPLRVIGVLSVKGQSSYGQDQDDVVLIPFELPSERSSACRHPPS